MLNDNSNLRLLWLLNFQSKDYYKFHIFFTSECLNAAFTPSKAEKNESNRDQFRVLNVNFVESDLEDR